MFRLFDVMQLLRVAQESVVHCTHLRLCQCAHMWLYSAALQWAHWQLVLIALPYPFVVQACIHTVGINMSRRSLDMTSDNYEVRMFYVVDVTSAISWVATAHPCES